MNERNAHGLDIKYDEIDHNDKDFISVLKCFVNIYETEEGTSISKHNMQIENKKECDGEF